MSGKFSNVQGATNMSVCTECSKEGCQEGYYRESCDEGSPKDAGCRIGNGLLAIIISSVSGFFLLIACMLLLIRKLNRVRIHPSKDMIQLPTPEQPVVASKEPIVKVSLNAV
jgi:hypothetical protein